MKKIILIALFVNLALAESTMCFKQGWNFLADIESVALDGGECKGKKSVDAMKKDGWTIVDIKVNPAKFGMDYVYIFKKGNEPIIVNQQITPQNNQAKGVAVQTQGGNIIITDELIRQISAKKEEKEKIDKSAKQLANGERMYKQSCANCHGEKGESTAYQTSRALNKLSEEDMVYAIRGYNLNDYDRGMGYLMAPYANFMTKDDAIGIHKYLQSINK